MGGTNETIAQGLRCHVNNGEVHIHDDKKALKFCCSEKTFKIEIENALQSLGDNEGVTTIQGVGLDLGIMRLGDRYSWFILDGMNALSQIKDFVNKI